MPHTRKALIPVARSAINPHYLTQFWTSHHQAHKPRSWGQGSGENKIKIMEFNTYNSQSCSIK